MALTGLVEGDDSVAEWSKALRLGRSPQGRGFKPHRCQSMCPVASARLLHGKFAFQQLLLWPNG